MPFYYGENIIHVYLPQKYLSLLITQTNTSELDKVINYLRNIFDYNDGNNTLIVVPTELPNINLRELLFN